MGSWSNTLKLIDYIQGRRRGKEANELERKALQDPFLQDALEGYDSVKGDHQATIRELEKRFDRKPKQNKRRLWVWAAAAMFVVFIGTQVYRWIQPVAVPPVIVQHEAKTKDSADFREKIKTHNTLEAARKPEVIAQNTETRQQTADLLKKVHASPDFEAAVSAVDISTDTAKSAGQHEIMVAGLDTKQENETAGEVETVEMKEFRVDSAIFADQNLANNFVSKSVSAGLQGRVAGLDARSADSNFRIRGMVSTPASADTKQVKGRVVDENGEPLIGVNVKLKNTSHGTVTDMDGQFSLAVPDNRKGTLTAAYIGYTGREVAVAPNTGDIRLQPDLALLNEVVVVGYGSGRKVHSSNSKTAERITLHPAEVSGLKPIGSEGDFVSYFRNNYNRTVCDAQKQKVNVLVEIDKKGWPVLLEIKEITCPELKNELIRLLEKSPEWTLKGKKVRLKFVL